MDESLPPDTPEDLPIETPFRWKISDTELLNMTEKDRAIYLNEKANRIYDVHMLEIEAIGPVSPEDKDRILNPEKYQSEDHSSQ